MTTLTCPYCSKTGTTAKAVTPGKMVRCPSCREPFAVPEMDDALSSLGIDLDCEVAKPYEEDPEDLIVAVKRAPAGPTTAPQSAPPMAATPRVESDLPPEPWYYGWLAATAWFVWNACKYLVILVFIVTAVVGTIMVGNSTDPRASLISAVLMVAVPTLAAAATLFTTFFAAALTMLLVDLARNMRECRFRS